MIHEYNWWFHIVGEFLYDEDLYRMSIVSKTWRKAVLEVPTINVKYSIKKTNNFLRLQLFSFAMHIHIYNCDNIAYLISQLSNSLKRFVKLSFHYSAKASKALNFHERDIVIIKPTQSLVCYPKLQDLCITGYPEDGTALLDTAKGWTQLTTLNLLNCKLLSTHTVTMLLAHCCNLTSLTISQSLFLSSLLLPVTIQPPSDINITTITTDNSNDSIATPNLPMVHFKPLKLKYLTIIKCPQFSLLSSTNTIHQATSRTIGYFLQSQLSLTSTPPDTIYPVPLLPSSMTALSMILPHLSLSPSITTPLLLSNPLWESLTYCDFSFTNVSCSDIEQCIQYMKSLQTLMLDNCHSLHGHLTLSSRKLTTFSCRNVHSLQMINLYVSCLQTLNILLCSNMTSLQIISYSLQRLQLTLLKRLQYFHFVLPELMYLDINGCEKIGFYSSDQMPWKRNEFSSTFNAEDNCTEHARKELVLQLRTQCPNLDWEKFQKHGIGNSSIFSWLLPDDSTFS